MFLEILGVKLELRALKAALRKIEYDASGQSRLVSSVGPEALGPLSVAAASDYIQALAFHCRVETLPAISREHRDPERITGLALYRLAVGFVVESADTPKTLDCFIDRVEAAAPGRIGAVEAASILDILRMAALIAAWRRATTCSEPVALVLGLRDLNAEHAVCRLLSYEAILDQDPSGHYAKLTTSTRQTYRKALEQISLRTGAREARVASEAIELSRRHSVSSIEGHVGYYLVWQGKQALEARLKGLAPRPATKSRFGIIGQGLLYIAVCLAVDVAIVGCLLGLFTTGSSVVSVALMAVLMAIAVSDIAATVATALLGARIEPRTSMAIEIGEDTIDSNPFGVCVPTLLISQDQVGELLEKMRRNHEAIGIRTCLFVLLTDYVDSDSREPSEEERGLLNFCVAGVEALNDQCRSQHGFSPFLVLHRERQFCMTQKMWMGRERKRGKIEDLNELICGGANRFACHAGNLASLSAVRFVLALDDDSEVDAGSFRAMAGSLLHPLMSPKPDLQGRIADGHAMMIADWAITRESARKWRFWEVFTGPTYYADECLETDETILKIGQGSYLLRSAGARSPARTLARHIGIGDQPTERILPNCETRDFFYDLMGVRVYNGKGLYQASAFHEAIGDRFPDDRVLSHDTLEGSWLRPAHCSNAVLTEEMPGDFHKLSDRQHRWLRGDWQNLWLLLFEGRHLGSITTDRLQLFLAWFHTAGYIRRAISPIALFLLLCVTILSPPDSATPLLLALAAAMLAPIYLYLLVSAVQATTPWLSPFLVDTLRKRLMFPSKRTAQTVVESHVKEVFRLIFLPHLFLISADAMVRSGIRYLFKSRLLEWKSSALVEHDVHASGISETYMKIVPLLALGLAIGSWILTSGGAAKWFIFSAWALAPLACVYICGRKQHDT